MQRSHNITMQQLINSVLSIATQAGILVLEHYKKPDNSTQKLDSTYLTKADIASHQCISQSLQLLMPNIPILSEEHADNHPYSIRKKWRDYWLIDPLDGTRDFINQTDEFCINIAYISKHRPVFGLIYHPVSQTHFYAHNNLGAFEKTQNNITPLKLQAGKTLKKFVVGNYSTQNPKLQPYLNKQVNYQLETLGSALKFAYLAKGLYDCYPKFGSCSEWDTAAGVCILEACGGGGI